MCAIGVGMAKTGLGGFGMVVVPILANIFGPKSSTGILLLLLIMADFFGVWYYHRHAELKKIIQLMPSALVGIIIGVYIGDKISDIQAGFKSGISNLFLYENKNLNEFTSIKNYPVTVVKKLDNIN